MLWASGGQAAGQQLDYGIRIEDGEEWAYIQVQDGKELIAAPLIRPQSGYLDLGDALGAHTETGPTLSMSGSFQPGSENKFSVEGTAAKTSGVLIVGFKLDYGELFGVPIAPQASMQFPIKADANGDATFSFELPSNWDPATNIYVQALVKDKKSDAGVVASNVIRANSSIAGTLMEDSSRIRILGFDYDELGQEAEASTNCISDETQAYIDLLNSPVAHYGAFLWQEGPGGFDGTDEEWEPSSHLSQHLMFTVEKAAPFRGGDWVANGCTASPDFDFKHCCDAHDYCYCVGGECPCEGGLFDARKACDQDLRDCIRGEGHPFLAGVYYRAVRAFGQSHFNGW